MVNKFLSFSIASLILCNSTFAAIHKDVPMMDDVPMSEVEPQPGKTSATSFDMSELQAAIDEVAYTKNQTLTYQDFLTSMFKRYSELQRDLIELQQRNRFFDLDGAFAEINKAMTSTISTDEALKMTYIAMARKITSENDLPQEFTQSMRSYAIKIAQILHPDFQTNEATLISILYESIRLCQKKREDFYRMLLSKPHLNKEYQEILNGLKIDLSDEFLGELINSAANYLTTFLQTQLESADPKPSLIIEEVTHEMISKRTVLPLLLKHFGEVSGLGLI